VSRARVDILYFEGCPNYQFARALVDEVAGELGIDADVHSVGVADPAAATEYRFLGSPTVRVNGRDVEPAAYERTDFAYSCRVYRTAAGVSGRPSKTWIREALVRATNEL
jgi:hypothetical protein